MRALVIAVGLCCVTACGTGGLRPHKLPDGGYELACNDRLSACLRALEDVCPWHGYDVVRASERRKRNDVPQVPDETMRSEVVIRCHRGDPLFGAEPPPAPMPDAGAAIDAGSQP